jgi:putative ABC transport system permease protein
VIGIASIARRSVVARPLRSVLTITGIGLGVGVLFASLAVNAGLDRSIARTVADIVGDADLRVSSFQEHGLSAESVTAIRSTLGVRLAAPVVEQKTYLQPPIDATNPVLAPVTVVGIDPEDSNIHPIAVSSGAPLERRDQPAAVITERLAVQDGYTIDSEITLQGSGDAEVFRVVGIVAGDGPVLGTPGRVVMLPIDAATRVFGLKGATRVDIALADGFSAADVERQLATKLTSDPYVIASPAELQASLDASTADFRGTTALVALLALFVGAFLIFNTLSMGVAERVREVALLRAAGATRRQIAGFILAGAAFLGVAGSALGLIAGVGLSQLMSGWVRTIGGVVFDTPDWPASVFAVAFGVGLLVTFAAAVEPAWRASHIPPVEALKSRSEPGREQRARLRWIALVFAVIGLVGVAVWPRGPGAITVGAERAIAIYALLLVITLLSPLLLPALARVAGMPFAAVAHTEERIARGGIVRDRSRTALTVGGLTVGLAMVVALGGVAENGRRAASAWLADVVAGDEVVTSIRPVAANEGVGDSLGAVPGVARVTPVATFDVAYRGQRLDAAAVVGADYLADGRLHFAAGDRDAALRALDNGGAAIVPLSQAQRLKLRVGDTMDLPIGGARVLTVRVAGVAERTLPGAAGEAVMLGWPDAAPLGVQGADFFAVRFAPGSATQARPALEEAARALALEPATLDHIQGAVSDALGRVFGLFDALAVAAVLVAALGIVNTLTMSVVERVREIGMLRAAGMTRGQVSRTVVVEAGILGVVGAVLGIATGLGAVAIMLAFAGPPANSAVDVPWRAIALCAALGVGASMLAAWYPARVAGRLSIVRAVQFE